MVIPSIDENIKKLMGSESHQSMVSRSSMKNGQPLFKREDICATRESLDIELRSIFHEFQIGKTYFNDKSVEYYKRVKLHSHEKAKSDTQNLIRTLEKGSITDNRFEEALRVLGFEIIDRSVTIKDDVGDLHTFSTSKTIEELGGSNG